MTCQSLELGNCMVYQQQLPARTISFSTRKCNAYLFFYLSIASYELSRFINRTSQVDKLYKQLKLVKPKWEKTASWPIQKKTNNKLFLISCYRQRPTNLSWSRYVDNQSFTCQTDGAKYEQQSMTMELQAYRLVTKINV